MDLSTLKPAPGSVKNNKRVGRGQGSGRGGTSTRGHKGDQSRSGYRSKPGFEGGQMPLKMRVPKFGFKNINRIEYQTVNLDTLQELADNHQVSKIDAAVLKSFGLIGKEKLPIKILGRGELKASLTVHATACSATAKAAIEAAGGNVQTT